MRLSGLRRLPLFASPGRIMSSSSCMITLVLLAGLAGCSSPSTTPTVDAATPLPVDAGVDAPDVLVPDAADAADPYSGPGVYFVACQRSSVCGHRRAYREPRTAHPRRLPRIIHEG